MSPAGGEPLYLDVSGTPTYAVLHEPAGLAQDTAVIICPPFGWEEVCAYRILREWAIRLADAGHPTLRLTFPSCGDSAGMPRDADRLDAWTQAVNVATVTLKAAVQAGAIVVIGIGLGGAVAYRAAATGAEIDGLVLWGTPARAKDLTRQLKAFSRLEYPQFFEGLPSPPPLAPGELEAGGFLLSVQTVADLNALDLSALMLPKGLRQGALLLGRDGMTVDERLRESLERQGVRTVVVPGDGYARMTSHPQQSELPQSVIHSVQAWLDEGSSRRERSTGDRPPMITVAEIQGTDETGVIETPVQVNAGSVKLPGILATPRGPSQSVCVVFLHSGAIRRIGPNRMWVEASRRWAARGVPSLRLDVEGIGDADGDMAPFRSDDALHDSKFLGQVEAAVDLLHQQGVADRFAFTGLCSGAHWSFHAALHHPRVDACFLVNPRALIYDTTLDPARDLRRALSGRVTWQSLRRNVTRRRVAAIIRLLAISGRRAWRRSRRPDDEALGLAARVDLLLRSLRDSGKLAVLIFAEREPLEEELISTGRLAEMQEWPNVRIEHVAVHDHTLRPVWAQQQTLAALDRALALEIERGSPRGRVTRDP